MRKFSAKIESTKPPPPIKRFDKYLRSGSVDENAAELILHDEYWPGFRSPKITSSLKEFLFKGTIYDSYKGLRRDEYLQKEYGIYSISYGKWVKDEDRFNFLAILAISFYDLSKILGSNNIGKGSLTIDWGGVGRKGAGGVYYSQFSLITLPRYKRPDKYLEALHNLGVDTRGLIKSYFTSFFSQGRDDMLSLNKAGKAWIMKTSGWGNFAHEYGHFIDNFLGQSIGKNFASGRNILPEFKAAFYSSSLIRKTRSNSLTSAEIQKIVTGLSDRYTHIQDAFADWLVAMYFIKQKDGYYRPNTQYKRLATYCNVNGGDWNYWGSLVECWARSFEVYVAEFLAHKGVINTFLVSKNAKFGRDIRILDGKPVVSIGGQSPYITAAHVWQNKKIFEKIINIFVKLNNN